MVVPNAKRTGYCSLVNLGDMSPFAALMIFTFESMKLLLLPIPVNLIAANRIRLGSRSRIRLADAPLELQNPELRSRSVSSLKLIRGSVSNW
jgi:hypothetical protein